MKKLILLLLPILLSPGQAHTSNQFNPISIHGLNVTIDNVTSGAKEGNITILEQYIKQALETSDSQGLLPIHTAIQGSQMETLEWLVKQGVSINATTP